MTRPRLLRLLGVADVASGVAALVAAGWLGDQLDVSATAVRIAGAVLAVLGVETILMAERRGMARATIVVEALAALLAVDLVVLGDPTGTGVALLLATAAWCALAAIEVALLGRTEQRALVTA